MHLKRTTHFQTFGKVKSNKHIHRGALRVFISFCFHMVADCAHRFSFDVSSTQEVNETVYLLLLLCSQLFREQSKTNEKTKTKNQPTKIQERWKRKEKQKCKRREKTCTEDFQSSSNTLTVDSVHTDQNNTCRVTITTFAHVFRWVFFSINGPKLCVVWSSLLFCFHWMCTFVQEIFFFKFSSIWTKRINEHSFSQSWFQKLCKLVYHSCCWWRRLLALHWSYCCSQ